MKTGGISIVCYRIYLSYAAFVSKSIHSGLLKSRVERGGKAESEVIKQIGKLGRGSWIGNYKANMQIRTRELGYTLTKTSMGFKKANTR